MNYTGKFFGEIEGEVMYSMIQKNIYVNLTIYDYQAVCMLDSNSLNAGSILLKVITIRYVHSSLL